MVERLHRWWPWVIVLVSAALYAPTIGHEYNLDDELVTVDHRNTSRGFAGIPDIFTEFYYEDDMGYRYGYRPVAHVIFAVEHAVFGQSPHVSHAINVLLYALLCVLIYWFIRRLDERIPWWAAAAGSLIFAVHPIHTEVVASIKNREEILALLFPVGAALLILRMRDRTLDGRMILGLLGASALFALGYFSKRSGVGFAFLLPLLLIRRSERTDAVRWDVVLLAALLAVPMAIDVRFLDPQQRWVLAGGLIGSVLLVTHFAMLRQAARRVGRTAGQWVWAFVRIDEGVRGVSIAWMMVSAVLLTVAWMLAAADGPNWMVMMLLSLHGLIAFGMQWRLGWHLIWVVLALVIAIFFDPESPILLPALITTALSLAVHGRGRRAVRVLVATTFVFGVGLSIFAERPWSEILLIVPMAGGLFLVLPALAHRVRWAVGVSAVFLGLHVFEYDLFGLLALMAAVVIWRRWGRGRPLRAGHQILLGILVLSSVWSSVRSDRLILAQDNPFRERIEAVIRPIEEWMTDRFDPEVTVREAPITMWWSVRSASERLAVPRSETLPPQVSDLDRPLTRVENPLIESFIWPDRIRVALASTGFYVYKMVWPHPLSFYYGYAVRDIPEWNDPEVWLGIASIVVLLALMVFGLWRSEPMLWVGALLVFLSLGVYSNLVTPVAGVVGERLAFQASLGLVLLLLPVLVRAANRWSLRPVWVGVAIVCIMASIHTVRRSVLWADRVTLFGHDVHHLETSAQANALYAYALLSSGQNPQADRQTALVHLDRALSIVPDYPNWWYDKGRVLWELGRFDESVPAFRAAVRYQDDLFLGPDRYLVDYAIQKRDPVALIDPARRMVRHASADVQLHDLLAESFLMTGRPDSALVYLTLQADQFPERAEPWITMARIHFKMSADSQGLDALDEAERRSATDPGVRSIVDSLRRSVNE